MQLTKPWHFITHKNKAQMERKLKRINRKGNKQNKLNYLPGHYSIFGFTTGKTKLNFPASFTSF